MELPLAHLTETWRKALDSGSTVAVAFVDFKKAFNSIFHTILLTKLERDFSIAGPLLHWIESYLKGRRQFTIVNGAKSDMLPVQYIWYPPRIGSRTNPFLPVHK